MRTRFLILAWTALGAASVEAQQVIIKSYSSGTGFFISRSGELLTNQHVVQNCREITVAGPVEETPATLVASDAEHDLALLRASANLSDIARLASDKQPLAMGDTVVIVGYPGQSWKSLRVVTRQSRITNTTGPMGEEKWLGFSDALAEGNSGGPLLDSAGNVVGVVAAKGKLYQKSAESDKNELIDHFDIAISLPVIRRFLDGHGVRYEEADSGLMLSTSHVSDIAQRFVVNVRCRID